MVNTAHGEHQGEFIKVNSRGVSSYRVVSSSNGKK